MDQPTVKPWWQDALSIFTKLSGWVILPLLLGFTLGRWLDSHYQSGSKWFFICIGVAFIVFTYGMTVRHARNTQN
jgi:membrane protein DedA with SNARE-associated domain